MLKDIPLVGLLNERENPEFQKSKESSTISIPNKSNDTFNGIGRMQAHFYDHNKLKKINYGTAFIISQKSVITSASNIYDQIAQQEATQIYFFSDGCKEKSLSKNPIKITHLKINQYFSFSQSQTKYKRNFAILFLDLNTNQNFQSNQVPMINLHHQIANQSLLQNGMFVKSKDKQKVTFGKINDQLKKYQVAEGNLKFISSEEKQGEAGSPLLIKKKLQNGKFAYKIIGLITQSSKKAKFGINFTYLLKSGQISAAQLTQLNQNQAILFRLTSSYTNLAKQKSSLQIQLSSSRQQCFKSLTNIQSQFTKQIQYKNIKISQLLNQTQKFSQIQKSLQKNLSQLEQKFQQIRQYNENVALKSFQTHNSNDKTNQNHTTLSQLSDLKQAIVQLTSEKTILNRHKKLLTQELQSLKRLSEKRNKQIEQQKLTFKLIERQKDKKIELLKKQIQYLQNLNKTVKNQVEAQINQKIQTINTKVKSIQANHVKQIQFIQTKFNQITKLNQSNTSTPQSNQQLPKLSPQQRRKLLFSTINDKSNHNLIVQFMQQRYSQDQHKINKYYVVNTDLKRFGWWSVDYLKKEYNVDLSHQAYSLFLLDKKVNMKLFIENANYSHIEQVNFSRGCCQIDDAGWKLLAQNAYRFPNIKILDLWSNKITNIMQSQLQQFVSLQYIDLRWNPLTENSFNELRIFKKNHPKVVIGITNNRKSQQWR